MSQLAKQTNASAQTKRRRVQIDEVDVASNTITGKDQYGLTFQITYGPYYDGNVIVIPKQGENWIVEQYRQEWRLKYKAEDLTSFVNFTLAPGDKLIDSGTLWINGNANLTNGYLTINDPTSAQHAATKNYVDTHGGGGAVDSVFGRAGIVTAQTGDYTVAQITGAAPLASPTFTGTVMVPTPSTGDDSTIVPTTHWVRQQGYITGSVVTSVFSRTGAVTAQTGDYTVAQITGAAPLASPTFTGIPAAPTPATADNSTTVATTAFVKNQGYVTAATSPVTSVFTRTGAVVAASGDYTLTQIGKGTQHALAISGATVMASLATGSSGQLLQSGGASADPAWTASTYPGTAGGIGHVPRSDGTNYVDAQLAATDISNGTVGLGAIVLASGPAMTNPTANTQTAGDNSTKLATTAFVTTAIAAVGSNLYKITQTSHGFTVGQILIYNGTAYVLAKADTADDAEVIGIVATVIDANNFILQIAGEVTGLSGLTAGTTYFLSDATAGLLTATVPTANGSISKPLGIAVSTTALFFYNMRGEVIQASASFPTVTTSSWSAGPPSSPSDGDLWIASGVDSNGTRWQFQYNAGSASANKWEFIGGPPMHVDDQTGGSTTSTSAVDLGGGSTVLTLTPGRAGNYAIRLGARAKVSAAGWASIRFYNYTDAPTTPIGSVAQSDDAGSVGDSVSTEFTASLLASKEYRARYDSSSGAVTATFDFGFLSILPVRIS